MNEFEFGLILAINSCSRETELLDARKKWSTHNNYSGKVFIVVDCRLPELHINDVEVLIHFKLPRVSLNAQGIMDLRFSSLKTVIKAIAERKINTSLDPDGKPLIKMEFNRPLPKAFIILFVTESDAQISEEIRDFLTETRKVKLKRVPQTVFRNGIDLSDCT